MITDHVAFRLGKSDAARCDDAIGTGGRDDAFAVTDGLGSSPATSGYFAQEAADWFVHDPLAAEAELSEPTPGEGDTSLATRWLANVHTLGQYLDNPQDSFESAGCTLVGVQLTTDDRATICVKGLAIGDCAAFILSDDAWEGFNSLGKLSEQSVRDDSGIATPNSLRVHFVERRLVTDEPPLKFEVAVEPGTTIVLATDALATWIHQRLLEGGPTDPELVTLLSLRRESRFVEWVHAQRFAGTLELDDVAFVRFTISAPSSPKKSPTTAGIVTSNAASSSPNEDTAARQLPPSPHGRLARMLALTGWIIAIAAVLLQQPEVKAWLHAHGLHIERMLDFDKADSPTPAPAAPR